MRLNRPFLLIALVALTTALPARAQSLQDPAWETLLENDRHDELESQARQRLKAEPGDPQATLALGFAVLVAARPASIDAAVPLAEACIARHPEAAECHYMLGNLLGVQALRGGMLKGMSLAGRIRELAERYATPLPKLIDEVEILAARVDEHLKKMGASWK